MANKTPKNPRKAFKEALDPQGIVLDNDGTQLEALNRFLAGKKKIRIFNKPKKG